MLPPSINCVLHIAPVGNPALRANVKLALLHPERSGEIPDFRGSLCSLSQQLEHEQSSNSVL